MKPRPDGSRPCSVWPALVCAALLALGGPQAAATCGNGVIDVGEACDAGPPLNLDGENCNTLGFPGGTLMCASDCLTFDTSACLAIPPCGNTLIEPGEVCDGAQLGLQTCESQGYPDGGSATRTNRERYQLMLRPELTKFTSCVSPLNQVNMARMTSMSACTLSLM